MKLKGKAKAAFLRRMARGRNKKHHKHSKRKRKHHTGGKHVARRRHHKKHHKSRGRRRGGGGSLGRWLPDQQRLIGMGTAFAYGKVEAAASKDQNHALNKVPNLIAAIGRAGNLGALLWVAGVVTRHPIVKAAASGVLHVAAYQNGRNSGGFSKDSPEFKLSGPWNGMGRALGHAGHAVGRGRDEMLVERYLRGQHQG